MIDKNDVTSMSPEDDKNSQVAQWLAKLDRGDLTKTEREEFSAWIAKEPSNITKLQNTTAFWYGLNEPFRQTIAQILPNTALSRHKKMGWTSGLAFSARFKPIMVASICFGFVGISAVSFIANTRTQKTVVANNNQFYSTSIGKVRVVALSDGSTIHLNTNTVIDQVYSKEERGIKLISGEAIFDVHHDEARSFKVYTSDGVIRAVGTRFAVHIGPMGVKVSVTDGRVILETPTGLGADKSGASILASIPIIVSKGEVAQMAHEATRATRQVPAEDITEQLAWAHGQLVFHSKDLQYVVDEISRYTSVRINIINEDIKTEKITGILQIGDVNVMLEGIEGALGVKTEWVSNSLVNISKE